MYISSRYNLAVRLIYQASTGWVYKTKLYNHIYIFFVKNA